MKIVVMGNSVGLRVRPASKDDPNSNIPFSQLLKSKFISDNKNIDIKNLCHGRFLIEHILNLRDEYIRQYPDVYIICAGITDCCNREIPLWLSNLLHGNRLSFSRRILMGFYIKLIKPFRPFFVLIRGRRPWRSLNRTKYGFEVLFNEISKNTSAKVIFLEILDIDDRIENELPGSRNNVKKMNEILREMISERGERFQFLALNDISRPLTRPDGIHMDENGHKLLANMLYSTLNKLSN